MLAEVLIGTVPLEGTIDNSQGFQPMGSVFTPQDYQSPAPFAWEVPEAAPEPDADDPHHFRYLREYMVYSASNLSNSEILKLK